MTFICYPKCTTCQKAQKWLDENSISYTFRDIKMEHPTYEELSAWHRRSGLPLKWGKSFLRPKSKKKRGGTPIQPMSGQAAQRMLYSRHLRDFLWITPSLERVCCPLTKSAC